MILSGHKIAEEVANGRIHIEPYNLEQVNPNSYNFTLGDSILTYSGTVLDVKNQNPFRIRTIPESGMVLRPDTLYLGHTAEIMGSQHYVPIMRGRSSVGRIGIFINITADLIDIGSINQWTLQMHVVQPVRVYPGMLIGQVTFWEIKGEVSLYEGKYQGSRGPRASEMYRDFQGND